MGIEVDEDLDFTNHCEILGRKISKRIGLLKHTSPYLKRNQREIYYKAKRAARIILDAEPRSRSVPLFNLLTWIPFYYESYAIRCSLLQLKRILGRTPVYLKQMLKLNSDTHNRSTHFSNLNFNCPCYINETGGRTFTVWSIKEWNNLDKDLKELKNAKALKKKVMNNLLSKQNSI